LLSWRFKKNARFEGAKILTFLTFTRYSSSFLIQSRNCSWFLFLQI
jgi:hypothetical protein